METVEAGWELEHRLQGLAQIRSRPGPPDEQGRQWMVRETTGLVSYQCNCGWSTGWVPRETVPLPDEAHRLHPAPDYSSSVS